jgi:cytochrome c
MHSPIFGRWVARAFIAGLLIATVVVPRSHAGAGELHKLAQKGNMAAIAALLEAGADVNETDGEGETALHKAAKAGNAEVVAELLAAGADPLISGTGPFGSTGTALHLAAKFGHTDVVRLLLQAGVDPNLNDPSVGPPLHLAIWSGRDDAAEMLRSYGAGPVSAPPIGPLIASADPQDGREIAKGCELCHLMNEAPASVRRMGPPLWGIAGRAKGAYPDYVYSDAMMAADGLWTYDDLNSFLADPKAYLPGTKMIGMERIAQPERRAALIRYLRDLSSAPLPLPD